MRIIRKKLSIFLIFILILPSMLMSAQASTYPSTEEEFFEYLAAIGLPEHNIKGQRANFEVYKEYGQVLYYKPHGELKDGSLCGRTKEYRYLGTDEQGRVITNYCFPNDATGGNAESWRYEIVDPDESTWNMYDLEQSTHAYLAILEGHGSKTRTVQNIGGQKYGRLMTEPSWYAKGSVYTEHISGGKTWYATFDIPSMIDGKVLTGRIATDKDTYTISAEDNDISVNYSVTAEAIDKGGYFRYSQVKTLRADLNPSNYDSINKYDGPFITSGTRYSTKSGSFKLTRAKYPEGTHQIKVEGETYLESKYGDKDFYKPSKTITLIVEPSSKKQVTTSVTVDPSSVKYEGTDVKVKVTVTGTLTGVSDVNKIKQWTFKARENEVTATTIKSNTNKSLTSSMTFDFTIPKNRIEGGMVNDEFIQKYVGRAEVQLVDGSIPQSTSDTATVIVFKNEAPPPEVGGPVADFTSSPSTDLKQGDTVSLNQSCTHPDNVPIVSWTWKQSGGVISNSQSASAELTNEGSNMFSLTCVDANGKSDTAYKSIAAGSPNIPPVASFFSEREYFWIEKVTPQNNSYDPDGTIVSSDWSVDSKPASLPLSFSRITQPELHTIGLTVTDDAGESDSTSKSVRILPTIPTADFIVSGFDNSSQRIDFAGKENRMMEIDATHSNAASPSIRVAPIDYSKTTYSIRPVTQGISQSDILTRQSGDKSKLQFLVRKAGTYEVTVTVTNNLGETSLPVTKEFVVEKDRAPIASFTVDKKKYLRDGTTKKATINLTDNSKSIDDDVIKKRTWFVEYDSNNDGVFGTNLDTPKQVIATGNQTSVTYQTDRVGNYRFSLEVTEGFGQPTLQEFIQEVHYRKDITESLNPRGNIDDYLLDVNFNVPEKDVAVEVDNAPPTVDFGMQVHKTVDIYLNFGGLDTATQQHQNGSVPGGGTYDHYSYTYDTVEKNRLTSLAANLETELISKGINCRVIIDNSYFKVADTDGTCKRNVPVYGWSTYSSTEYDSVTTTSSSYSPPSGWSITSSSSKSYYKTRTEYTETSCLKPCTYQPKPSGTGWYWADGWSTTTHVHDVWGRDVKELDYTEYTYNLKKTTYYESWEVQYYSTTGCNSTEQVNTTDFTQSFANSTYRLDSDRFYIHFDKRDWTWYSDSTKRNNFHSKMKNQNIYFWDTGNESLRNTVNLAIWNGSLKGQFTTYNPIGPDKQVQDIRDYFINQYMTIATGESFTIVLGDKIDYTVTYEDFENDPELKREWKFTHDPTRINGRTIDNQSEQIAQSGVWINSPMQLGSPGTYMVELRSMDNPIWFNDDRFFNYRKWSDEEIVREYSVNVHRRPVADFRFTLDRANNNQLTLDPSLSYDPDFETNRVDKGIVEYQWSYWLDGVSYTGQPPTNLLSNKYYDVTLQVRDVDGAFASITKRINTTNANLKPVAHFEVDSTVYHNQSLEFSDLSYDPDGDSLTDYRITVRNQGQATILRTLTQWPVNFASMGLPAGDYTIGLTVKDIPRFGTALTSDLYERNIKVINDNRAPVSVFTLSPTPVNKGSLLTYTDSSYDPDNHPLVNYSWKVELLSSTNTVLQSWITGVVPKDLRDFAGIGRYRITQTVFDQPPFPLPSLSGSSSVIVEMVQGPEPPFAEFTWHPSNRDIIEGDTFILDPTYSYDLDGEVVSFAWTIKNPLGQITTSSERFPKVINSIRGDYEISLHVYDNDGLRSKIQAVHKITVKPLPPNIPPVANFSWEPFKPFLGEDIGFNPDSSYDTDGTIVGWHWTFRRVDNGTSITSTLQYPTIIAATSQYLVTLRVTDNRGASATVSKTIDVDIASLEALVTHTPEWSAKWVEQGESPDVNVFYAGEKFIIKLTSTPANRVWGSVHFGGSVGLVDIPSSSFRLVSTSAYRYTWEAELWREDFETIMDGEYIFNFSSLHPVNSPSVQANTSYLVKISGNIYSALGYHQKY